MAGLDRVRIVGLHAKYSNGDSAAEDKDKETTATTTTTTTTKSWTPAVQRPLRPTARPPSLQPDIMMGATLFLAHSATTITPGTR